MFEKTPQEWATDARSVGDQDIVDCPECAGCGTVWPDYEARDAENCPRCNGEGKVWLPVRQTMSFRSSAENRKPAERFIK